MRTYKIRATVIDHFGEVVESNNPEVLGESFGKKYPTKGEAEAVADDLAATLPEKYGDVQFEVVAEQENK